MNKYVIGFLVAIMPCVALAQSGGIARDDSPGLVVTPTRLVLEGKEHSGVISLANNGTKAGIYKIELVNKRMSDDGKFETVTAANLDEKFADEILRVSPRRVTLAPGEHQNIRILARKTPGMADGEYRSHLNFLIVPVDDAPKDKNKEVPVDNGLSITIKTNFGVTIPVIVRQGTLQATGQMSGLSLKRDAQGQWVAAFTVHRKGDKSLYGDVTITHKAADGTQTVLKTLGGVAVYTPNAQRIFNMSFVAPEGVSLSQGTLEIAYREKEKDGGALIAQGELALQR